MTLLVCPIKTHYDFPCPGCGATKALKLLFSGDIGAGIMEYPPIVLIILLVIYWFFGMVFPHRKQARLMGILVASTFLAVLINWLSYWIW